MTELYTSVAGQQLNFEGLFSMREVFRIIDKFFRLKGFDKKIDFDEEYNSENGKYIHVKAQYYKKTDSYVRLVNRLWIYGNNLIEVEKEVEGKKIKTHQGNISITFDGFVQTDYFNNLDDNKPLYFLIRVLYEQYIAKGRVDYWQDVVRHLTTELKTEVSGYLNLNKFLYER